MNGVHIRRPETRGEATRGMIAWTGRWLSLAVRPVTCAVRMALNEQVKMWECVLVTSGVAPLTTAGPLRWVRSIDGYSLAGRDLPAPEPAETGR